MKRKIISIDANCDYSPGEGRYLTWINVTTAYPHIEQVGNTFVVTMKDPQRITTRIMASKEDGAYSREEIIKGFQSLIDELTKTYKK